MSVQSKCTPKIKMVYNIDWILPTLRQPTKLWYFASTITVAAVGLFTKLFIGNYELIKTP